MDTFVDSSWYFYRYLDPQNAGAPFDAEKARAWFPIDLYIGGVEHAILHLIYCRFWTKMMRDLGLAATDEPVIRQLSQGMVIKDGAKMSKSKGNIVDPDAVVERHGADAIRLYVLFESPPEKEMDWTDARLSGPARFLRRLERMIPGDAEWLASTPLPVGDEDFAPEDVALRRKTHQTIRRVTRDLEERIHPNTAIAAIMELTSAFSHRLPEAAGEASRRAVREAAETVISLLNPMAPHLTEELWERLGGGAMLVETPWPACDEDLARGGTGARRAAGERETPGSSRGAGGNRTRGTARPGPGECGDPPSPGGTRGSPYRDRAGPARELRGGPPVVIPAARAASRERGGDSGRSWTAMLVSGLLFLGVAAGCGYRLAGLGGGLPGHIQVVAILPFDNESAFPEVEEGMTEQIIEGFNRRGRYEVQETEEGAEAVMRGTVLSVDFSPAQLDPATGAASTYLIIVRATVEFTDVVNDVVLFESDEFTLRDEFSIGDDPDAAFDREGLAFSRIASAFADSLLVAILEGF